VNVLREDAVLDTVRKYTPNYDQLHIFQKVRLATAAL
jgi:hypothetical protein